MFFITGLLTLFCSTPNSQLKNHEYKTEVWHHIFFIFSKIHFKESHNEEFKKKCFSFIKLTIAIASIPIRCNFFVHFISIFQIVFTVTVVRRKLFLRFDIVLNTGGLLAEDLCLSLTAPGSGRVVSALVQPPGFKE